MKIHFFEEFPTKKNLEKLKLINFPSLVYVTAKSFKEFANLKKQIKKTNPKFEVAYWPVLEKSYWISPFSYNFELKKLYDDLLANKTKNSLKILLDLELPFLNKKLFLLNFILVFLNLIPR